jgi:hypothetical protein
MPALRSIATALDKGDLARAIIITQFMRLPPLVDDGARCRAIKADQLAKAGFNPNQARDDHGRWTSSGSTYKPGSQIEYTHAANTSQDLQQVADVCTNCHEVPPVVPPPSRGPFDNFIFGPSTLPSAQKPGYTKALQECHSICIENYLEGKLFGRPGIKGSDMPSHYRVCMRNCLRNKGYEDY